MDLDFEEINVFSGSNDSGKSNVLKALNLFFNNVTDFDSPLEFQSDFPKVELAKVQESSKSEKTIRIMVFIKPPPRMIRYSENREYGSSEFSTETITFR